MPDTKISALTAATAVGLTDIVPIVSGGANYQATGQQLAGIADNQTAYNFTPAFTHGIRRKIAQALSGRAACKLGFFGDSTTFGTTGGTSLSGNIKVSRPYRLYQYLKGMGLNVRFDGVTWASFVTADGNPSSTDARFKAASGWTTSNANGAAPGNLTNPITFTPDGVWDTAVITYYDVSAGTLRLQVDSETAVDTTLTGSGTWKTATVTTTAGAAGAKAVKVFMTTGRFRAIDCYNSATPDLRILNLGHPGIGFSADPTTGTQLSKAITVMGIDVLTTMMGVNDFSSNAASTWQGYYNQHIGQITGCSHMIEVPLMNTSVTDAIQNTYVTAMYAIADASALPLVNWRKRYGDTNALVSSNGWQTDALHPNSDTYYDQGAYLGKRLVGMHG